MATTYAIKYNPKAGGKAVIDKEMGSEAQYAYLRKGGFYFGSTLGESCRTGIYSPGHKKNADELIKDFATKFATGAHTITLTEDTTL